MFLIFPNSTSSNLVYQDPTPNSDTTHSKKVEAYKLTKNGLPQEHYVYTPGQIVLYDTEQYEVTHMKRCKGRRSQAREYTRSQECNVLLLGNNGAVGLDLSMVTHVFLLDGIWDAGLEDQVISRAYRLGAHKPIVVNQLLMKDSVEAIMYKKRKEVKKQVQTKRAVSEMEELKLVLDSMALIRN